MNHEISRNGTKPEAKKMTMRTKTGLEILQVSVLLGVLGNVLLRQTPWGLNAFLFVAAFVAALLTLTWRHRPELLTKTNIALGGAMVFFASMFLIRDAEELLVWDTLAILVLMGVLLLGNFDIKAHVAGTFHYAAGFVWSGLTSAFGPFLLLGADIDWKSMPGGNVSKHIFAVLRGLAIALPLVLIFGALFMAADAVFEGMVNRALNFDIETVISHAVITSVFAWLTAGYFRGALTIPFAPKPETAATGVGSPHVSKGSTSPTANGEEPHAETTDCGSPRFSKGDTPNADAQVSSADGSFVAKMAAEPGEQPNSLPNNATIIEHINADDRNANFSSQVVEDQADGRTEVRVSKRDWQNIDSSKLSPVFTIGTIETVLILGLVDLLFLAFVAVQVPYLFGGMDLVQNTPDFKLADYARRGFGELVAVAALVLPMLLLSHWLLRKDGSRVGGMYKVLAGVQIALLFVIMASAVQRLVLLTGELGYGWTTVRFYPTVLIVWLAVVFVWFAATVLSGRRNHFAWGALWSAVFILGATNLFNPHAFIVQKNIDLMQQGRSFDVYYNSRLSDDAAPTLIGNFEKLDSDAAAAALSELRWRACRKLEEKDIRSWNSSRSEASKIFATYGVDDSDSLKCPSGLGDRHHD